MIAELKRKWFYPLVAALIYSATIFVGILSTTDFTINETLSGMHSYPFYIGVVLAIIISAVIIVAYRRVGNKVSQYIMSGVSFILIGVGILYIRLSYFTDLWGNNPPYNPSVFGAGISITAIGLAFLFAVRPRYGQTINENTQTATHKLNEKIGELRTEAERVEKIVKECKELTTQLNELKEVDKNIGE